MFPFEESWDLRRDMAVARYEAVCTRDLATVVDTIGEYRRRVRIMAQERVRLPEVARYFRET